MKTKTEFMSFYQEYLKELGNLPVNRVKKTFMLCFGLSILFCLISVTLYNFLDNSFVFLVLLFIPVLIVEGRKRYNYILEEYRYEIISRIIGFLSNGKYTSIKEGMMISKSAVNDCDLFNTDGLKISGGYYTVFSAGKYNIILSDLDILYPDVEGYNKKLFSGVYFSATFNKPIREQVYVIPNQVKDTIINKYGKYLDYSGVRVKLENNEFEKKYNVYSTDELQARYILSLRLMERINDIEKIFGGKKYIVFKKTGKISILFSGLSTEYEINKKIKFISKKGRFSFCESIFKYFNNYLEIYEILDLENRLYLMGGDN